eukprot:TRINITY_DN788_c0_g1_i1.p1 TRINITY_DN788_c0_g1~~TRINITY_DN788_c0_g1_i1.p1  ORF type:complete len:246 (-),score=55.35 TRINITY_DN788_c0_g1_i1:10-747(-)
MMKRTVASVLSFQRGLSSSSFARTTFLCPSFKPIQTPIKRTFYTLQPLKYPIEDGVLPFISPTSLNTHYHHVNLSYCKLVNDLIMGKEGLNAMSPKDLIARVKYDASDALLYHSLGSVLNHVLFFESIKPGGAKMSSDMQKLIELNYGNVEEFQRRFNRNANSIFGNGWTFLVLREGRLEIINTKDGATVYGEEGIEPLLCLDVWEHSYFQDYENRRSDYVARFWKVVDWSEVERKIKNLTPDIW